MNSTALQLASTRESLKINPLNLSLFVLGALINCASYLSFAPVLLAVFFFGFLHSTIFDTTGGRLGTAHIFPHIPGRFSHGWRCSSLCQPVTRSFSAI